MESRDGRLRQGPSADQLIYALGHLRGSLVRERHRQHGISRNPSILNQMSYAVGNYPRFARTSARQDEHRPIHGLNGFALLGIEFGEKIHGLLQDYQGMGGKRAEGKGQNAKREIGC
jgi:hypothetical protein